jgi:hypothetical protein
MHVMIEPTSPLPASNMVVQTGFETSLRSPMTLLRRVSPVSVFPKASNMSYSHTAYAQQISYALPAHLAVGETQFRRSTIDTLASETLVVRSFRLHQNQNQAIRQVTTPENILPK